MNCGGNLRRPASGGMCESGFVLRALIFSWVIFLALAAGCVTVEPNADVVSVGALDQFQPDWQPLFKGVKVAAARLTGDVPQTAYAIRIDLQAPGIEFLATPSNGEESARTDGRKTSTFLEEFKLQAAVNASPFSSVQAGEGRVKKVLGLSVSRGDAYSAPNGSYSALIITKDNRARIVSPPYEIDDAYNAVGGFKMLLRDGRDVAADGERHPRTAVGISKDGRYMYLLVIDGRQGSYSAGATTSETARWLLRLGAWTGLNLDGGGSTSMVIEGREGMAQVINRPIHNNIPGTERINANHLGVYASPLD